MSSEKPTRVSRLYNIPYGLSDADWEKLTDVFAQLPGYLGQDDALWFGQIETDRYLTLSVEPIGLPFSGNLEAPAWNDWDQQFTMLASKALGYDVTDFGN